MANYVIQKTNGTTLVNIAPGNVDTSYSSLTLFGENAVNYGVPFNENLVGLLENFSNNVPPLNPILGQLWWDSANNQLKVRNTNTWKVASGPTVAALPPANMQAGDLWWDSTNSQLNVFTGTGWIVTGPAYSSRFSPNGPSGVVTSQISDVGGGLHVVLEFYINNSIVAIFSNDAAFNTSIPGFLTIVPGINILDTSMYSGTAQNAQLFNNSAASSFLLANGGVSISGNLVVSSNNTFSIGAPTMLVKDIYATTFHGNVVANAADLAEIYSTNTVIEPGTVVEFGGDFDVRVSIEDGTHRVAGVVSTDPAFVMNQECSERFTVAVALQGRVPCKVSGNVRKGDCMVSAGNGRARAEARPLPGTILGKSLQDFYGSEATIEIAVGRC